MSLLPITGGSQKAKEHLSALGTMEPSLPLFDEPKYKPVPEVEIELADEHDIKIDER